MQLHRNYLIHIYLESQQNVYININNVAIKPAN